MSKPLGQMAVLHVTTSHYAHDLRIYEKEGLSLAKVCGKVLIAGAGTVPAHPNLVHIPLKSRPKRRSKRWAVGQVRALALTTTIDYDVLHLHDPELIPLGIAAAAQGKRVVWDAHEDYVLRVRRVRKTVPGAEPLISAPMQRTLAALDRRAAGVVAATPSIAANYVNPNLAIVGNEAKLDEFSSCTPQHSSRQVLFIGSATPYQLFPEIVEAVARVPGTRLAVAGRKLSADWERTVGNKLPGRFLHLGWLERDGLVKAMNDSFLGCATLHDGPIGVDNSSNKVFEFAAAGLPSLLSPTPSNRSHINKGAIGYLARGFDAPSIEEAIREAIADPNEWQRRSTQARLWSSEHGNWESSERRLFELYERVAWN